MKVIFKAVLIILTIATTLPVGKLYAESSTEISPAFLEYTSEPGTVSVQSITISNKTQTAYSFSIRPIMIGNNPSILDISDLENESILSIDQIDLSLEPNESKDIQVTINIEESILNEDKLPAIEVSSSESGSEDVSVSQRYIIPVRISFNIETEYNIEIGLTTAPNILFNNSDFYIVGSMVNKQNRSINPAGRFEIHHTGKLIRTIPITDSLPEIARKDEIVSVSKIVQGEDILEPYRSYEIKLFITDVETGKEFTTSYTTYYIPSETILVLAGIIVLMLIFAIFKYRQNLIFRNANKEKKSKKDRKNN